MLVVGSGAWPASASGILQATPTGAAIMHCFHLTADSPELTEPVLGLGYGLHCH